MTTQMCDVIYDKYLTNYLEEFPKLRLSVDTWIEMYLEYSM